MEVNRQKRTIGRLSLDKRTLGVRNSQDREKLLQMLSDGCQPTETHRRVPLTQQKNTWLDRFQPGFPAPSLRLLCLGALGPGPLGAGPLGAGALLGIARETKTHRIARDCSGLLGIARDCSGLLGIAWAGWAGWAPQNELSVSLLLQLNCNSHNKKNVSYSIMIKAH